MWTSTLWQLTKRGKQVQSDCSSSAWIQLSCACVKAGARLPRGALLIGWGPCIMDGVHSEDPLRNCLIIRDYQVSTLTKSLRFLRNHASLDHLHSVFAG